MKKNILISLIILIFIGCSKTPGDAAYSGGHFEQAADLYKQSANRGDSLSALKIGLLLEQKQILSKDYGSASKWFIRACSLGSNPGCHNSGNAYEYGKFEVKKNYNKAREYYTIAATNGFIQSQYNLASLYSNKYFDNDIEGLKWMLIARQSAKKCLDIPICKWILKDPPNHYNKLINRMDKYQIEKAQEEATYFKNTRK